MKIGAVMFFTTYSMQPAALARELEQRGDAGGAAAWGRVAIVLSQPRKPYDEQHDGGERGKLY